MSALPEIRNLRFDLGSAIPRHWHGGRRSVTTFFDNLSVFFPAGERFFIASVHAYEGRVTDEKLKAAMRAFCGQEGIHSREHVRYNEMLAAAGYPVADMEKRVQGRLRRASRQLPRRGQLAITCALEHFTALLGQLVLSDPKILEGADPTMAALWRWHSAEENEHKAVAFDVFQAVGGTYRQRAALMVLVTIIFWGKVLEHQARMMKVDGTLLSPSEWAKLVQFLFVEPGGMGGVMRQYFEYFRPDFHPNDIDSNPLVKAWEAAYVEKREPAVA
jgi:predicted metal-dependent hydrolase